MHVQWYAEGLFPCRRGTTELAVSKLPIHHILTYYNKQNSADCNMFSIHTISLQILATELCCFAILVPCSTVTAGMTIQHGDTEQHHDSYLA